MKNPNKKERTEEILIGHKEKFEKIIYKKGGEILIRLPSGKIVKPDSVKSSLRHQKEKGGGIRLLHGYPNKLHLMH